MAQHRKTKKLINVPEDVISELIEGMVAAHPDLLRVEGTTRRAIVAVDGPRDGKVGIVIGGGSGHEPLFSGYVGRGLADASAVGNVFASPSPQQIADAARASDGGAGVLFLYGNYAGDVMNFDMAAELLAAEGIEARTVRIIDDVASASSERREERRGIAGDVLVFKIAGAAADRGLDLDGVERLARHANDRTASMGVALGPCSLPQTAVPNFEIGDDEMEIGMGIHGEPGVERVALETADAVADRLLDPILDDLRVSAGDSVAVMVNGLGSTSMMELYILYRRVASVLSERGVTSHLSWVGEFATSLEMAGASITLMRLDVELRGLLDHPCRTVALQVGTGPTAPAERSDRARTAKPASRVARRANASALITTGEVTPEIFRKMMLAVAARIIEEKDRLSELDGIIGDGDHGVTMEIGWSAVRGSLRQAGPDATIADLCREMSSSFLDAVGASAGPLYATGMDRAADAVSDRLNLDAASFVAWLAAMSDGIQSRGGAAPGDKTMVDAWVPAVQAAREALTGAASVMACLSAAAEAAERGASKTADMEARRGRSAKLGKRSLGHVDAGAASAAIMISAMAEAAAKSVR